MDDKCVYCGKSNEFNGEHMFSAGLGGDDKNYILENCVCTKCNNELSKLEIELMRKSVVGFARSMYQETGRDRGNKTEPPKMQFQPTHLWADGIPLEALNLPKLTAKILPQIVICPEYVFGTADNDQEWNDFFCKLEQLFTKEDILLIEKVRVDNASQFKVTEMKRQDGHFTFGNTTVQKKAPKGALWFNLEDSADLSPEQLSTFPPRFYLHDGKTINYKSTDTITFLTDINHAFNYFKNTPINPDYEDTTIKQPLMRGGISGDMRAADRALAKNGLNLLIKVMGAEYVRDECFSEIKLSILEGEPELPFGMRGRDDPIQPFFGNVPSNHHVMFLAAMSTGNDRAMIVFAIKLYGGAAFQYCLATNAPDPKWRQPIYCLVDFQNHEIKPVSAIEYTRTYCPEVMQLSPLGAAQEPGRS